jgi:hypothetical protein
MTATLDITQPPPTEVALPSPDAPGVDLIAVPAAFWILVPTQQETLH